MDAETHLEIRGPIEALEAALIRRELADPDTIGPERFQQLRYVLSFAKLTELRNATGDDVEIAGRIAPHRWRVAEALKPHLMQEGKGLVEAAKVLPDLLDGTRTQQALLLQQGDVDQESLTEEVCNRQLVLVAGGGGGSGFGYSGAYTLLNRHGLEPELVAGTSMGALMGLLRARTRIFDLAPMVAAAENLSWGKVFRILDLDSRYGVPATLRLYLRASTVWVKNAYTYIYIYD